MSSYTVTSTPVQDVALAQYIAEVNARAQEEHTRVKAQFALVGKEPPPAPAPITAASWVQDQADTVFSRLSEQYGPRVTEVAIRAFAAAKPEVQAEVLDLLGLGFLKAAKPEEILGVAPALAPAAFAKLDAAAQGKVLFTLGLV